MTLTQSTLTEAPPQRPAQAPVQTIAEAPPSSVPEPPLDPTTGGRQPFRYTIERYHEAIAAGTLTPLDKVELIFGQLIKKMSIGKRHGDCVDLLVDYFGERFRKTHRCRAQNPVTLPTANSEPEPDFAVVDRTTYRSRVGNPEPPDINLIIEVADTILRHDRTVKAKMYALAGLPEYWIINLKDDQIEVHTEPAVAQGEYNNVRRYGKDATFESAFAGGIRVADLLPEAVPGEVVTDGE